ncbi:hypothetical protein SKA40_15160 [Enterococcus faecium]
MGNPSLNHRYRKGFYSLFKTLQQNRSYLLKRAGKDNSFWRLTKVTVAATAVILTAILPLYM